MAARAEDAHRSARERTPAMAARFNCPPSRGDEADVRHLLKAALDGNLDRLKGIVKSIAKGNGDVGSVFTLNIGGIGVLHVAACAGNLQICKYLVEELGGDVNASGCGARAQGATPLMKAAQAGHVPTVKYFIDCGGDLMKVDDKGRTVLHHAAGTGSCEVTELLLSKGMPVDLDFGRGTPLIIASINGEHKTLKILLDHQADPNITTTGVGLPMLHALIYRSFECMKLLIEAGADVNCKGSMMNPLVFATMQGGYTNYIKLLLKTGADPNIPDDLGRLPLQLSALRGCWEEVEMLFPLTAQIPSAPIWSIEGVISHAKIQDKTPMVRGGQEDAGKIKAIADMTSQRKERDLTNASMRGSNYTLKIQAFVVFGKLNISVHAPLQSTVREVVSRAASKLGVIFHDYYIICPSGILELDETLWSQNIPPGSFLTPRWRLRGGVLLPLRMRWDQPFIDYTHTFGDELFDLCSIPNEGITVCLDRIGTHICFQLIRMLHVLFKRGICVPIFNSGDILYNHTTECFIFRPDFEGYTDNITDELFASSMRCLAYIIRRTFRFSPRRVREGLPVIRVLVHGDDTSEVIGQLPSYVAYLVTDLMNVAEIEANASADELMDYFITHVASKTTIARISYELDMALHLKCYPGGATAFDDCMEYLMFRWTDFMSGMLIMTRLFGNLVDMQKQSLAWFSLHIRHFISHPEIHGMSEKQADALVMLQASRFVHLLSIEFSLKIPVRIRMGGGTVQDGERIVQAPVAVPLSADSPYAVDGFTAKQIGEL